MSTVQSGVVGVGLLLGAIQAMINTGKLKMGLDFYSSAYLKPTFTVDIKISTKPLKT